MDLEQDPILIISSACRLPLDITSPSQLWDAFCGSVDSRSVFSSLESVPKSRHPDPRAFIDPARVGGAGWLGKEGVEFFDPTFFNISPAQAVVLRPNARLALELTWEALERAGIPPSTLRGKNVAVSIGSGTEDGWDLRRFAEDKSGAFDHRWASNSDPSGVSGQVAHFFDFRGPSSVISTACSSGAFALRDGIHALLHEDCEFAIVGAITTHFFTAPFDWAASVNVASKRGQCAAFSSEADGYVPSEGAVFLVLKKSSMTHIKTAPALAVIRSLCTGHNGATQTLVTPNVSAQVALTRRSLRVAGLSPSDICLLEAHGTGTRLGDAMEAEAFRSVYDNDEPRDGPLWISSSKSLFGHCQAASMLVGILKVLTVFEHKTIPPHLVDPLPDFKEGNILIPSSLIPISQQRPILAQVCSFGFTGSIASLILEAPSETRLDPGRSKELAHPYILPFSAKTKNVLNAQIKAIHRWALQAECSLYDLSAMLSLARDHHSVRLAIVASRIDDLENVAVESYVPNDGYNVAINAPLETNILNLPPSSLSEADTAIMNDLLEKKQIFHAACFLYNKGHNLHFEEIYDLNRVEKLGQYLQSFPTYTFDRRLCWTTTPATMTLENVALRSPVEHSRESIPPQKSTQPISIDSIAGVIASVLDISAQDVRPQSDIFDLGINSLTSIELTSALSQAFGLSVPVLELYNLQTVQALYDFLVETGRELGSLKTVSQNRFSQSDVDEWVAKYGSLPDSPLDSSATKEKLSNGVSVLLTGANGTLGCHVLHSLLSRPNVAHVFCPVRGNAWDRLLRAYSSHGYDDAELVKGRDAERLYVFHVSDLGDEYIGCGPEMHRQLLRNIDIIVHLAWKLDFNLPTSSFQACIEGSRNLAQFCIAANKHVDYYFISSFSAYFGFKESTIPEKPLTADLGASLDQGYAVSKLITEHALFLLHQKSSDAFSLRVVRIGQICGSSATGNWSTNEMIPMIINSLPSLGMVPRNLPDVSWIPSDICASTIADFVLSRSLEPLRVLHVANPRIVPWSVVAEMLAQLAGLKSVALASLRDYIEAIRSASVRTEIAVARLLPYFSGVVQRGDLPSQYASLEVAESMVCSASLAACPEINEAFLKPIVKYLLGTQLDAKSGELNASRSLESPVLLFAPWSEFVPSSMAISQEVRSQVERAASRVKQEIKYNAEDKSLDHQLATLIGQVSVYEEVKKRHVIPRAVLGYCFGEYAASVCADILSLETAVDIIVRRAAALREAKGSMLNVFAELKDVKRQLLKLPFDMEIAIYAGPTHYILSGSPEHISSAQETLRNAGLKTKLVETSIPFHSAVMDNVITSLKVPEVNCNSESCTYISGLTGNCISGKRLGSKYWLRHMRDPVLFVDAVRYIQKHFPSSPLVDVGPGRMLSSIISRYRWDGCEIFSVEKFLNADHTPISTGPVQTSKGTSQMIPTEPGLADPARTTTMSSSAESGQKMDREKAESAVADILISAFGFAGSDPRNLLSRSFLMLGLQSLDFIAFSEKVKDATGLMLPPSSFASDSTLGEILESLTSSVGE